MDGLLRWKRVRRWLVIGSTLGLAITAACCWNGIHRGWWQRAAAEVSARNSSRDIPRPSSDGSSSKRNAKQEGALTLYDCGSVMAGDQLRHVFTFQNSFPHELTLNAEVDLRKSCGCTTASLAHHRLESGQATTLAVEVDTRSKRGLIHEVVGVAWTDALGRRYEYGYAVRAMVNVAIVCHPPELTFSSSEVAEGTIKRVECSSDLAVDWENAKLLTSSPDLEIVHQLITKQNRLQVELRRRDAGTATYETAQVRINVPRKMCSAKRSESNDGRLGVEGQLLVFSRHQPTLAVRPRFPCFHVKGDSTTWSGRLIITGDAVAGGEQLDSIYSSEGTVDFRAEALGHGALQADVTLVPRKFGADLRTMTMPLVVRMVNGQEIRVVVQLSKTA